MSESSSWEIHPCVPIEKQKPKPTFHRCHFHCGQEHQCIQQGRSPHALCLGIGTGALLQTWTGDGAKSQAVTPAATLAADQLLDHLFCPTRSSHPYKGMLCTQETIVTQPGCSQLNPSAVCFPASIVGQAQAAGISSSFLGSPLVDAGLMQGAVTTERGSRPRSKLCSVK